MTSAATSTQTLTFSYDQLGRRASLTRGNGTSTTYGYDPVSRLASLVQSLPGTSHDLTLGFTYNPASQIATNTRSNDLYSFTGHSNATRAYTNDGLNRMTSSGPTAIAYDDNRGNITDIGATTYTYNSENMLVSGGGIALAWDPLMRLYQASTSRWAYDGAEMIAEYNTSNALLRRFVHGPGVDEPLVWYEGAGTANRRWLHADERGSVVAISDGTGTVTGTNHYNEYGAPASPTAGRFQYTGQVWLASLGLYHYRARFYHPGLGRFMQPDPIGYGSGMNLYAYVLNDPVNLTDPLGLAWYRWCAGSDGQWFCDMTWLEDLSSLPVIAAAISSNESGGAGGEGLDRAVSSAPERERECSAFQQVMQRIADEAAEASAAGTDVALAFTALGIGSAAFGNLAGAFVGARGATYALSIASIAGSIGFAADVLAGNTASAAAARMADTVIGRVTRFFPEAVQSQISEAITGQFPSSRCASGE